MRNPHSVWLTEKILLTRRYFQKQETTLATDRVPGKRGWPVKSELIPMPVRGQSAQTHPGESTLRMPPALALLSYRNIFSPPAPARRAAGQSGHARPDRWQCCLRSPRATESAAAAGPWPAVTPPE